MKRKLIEIDESLCDGCGICVRACHEGAIMLRNKKAVLMRDDYCDGLGDCLPTCPRNAIRFIEKDTLAYNEVAVKANMMKNIQMKPLVKVDVKTSSQEGQALLSWPIQLALAPIESDVYKNRKLLIAADCTAFAYHNFHQAFLQGNVALIACTKLDQYAYQEKLCEIFKKNEIAQIQVVRMEVPCCKKLADIVAQALVESGKQVPLTTTILTRNGKIV